MQRAGLEYESAYCHTPIHSLYPSQEGVQFRNAHCWHRTEVTSLLKGWVSTHTSCQHVFQTIIVDSWHPQGVHHFQPVTSEKLTNHPSLGFLICKIKIIIVLYHKIVMRIKWGNPCKALSTMPCTYKPSINISCCFSSILLSWFGILRTHLYWSRDLGNLLDKRQQMNHLITGEKLTGHCIHCSLLQITYKETLMNSLSFPTLILCEKWAYPLRLEKIDSVRMRS